MHKARLDFLDGVRALAALWVMIGHCHLFALGWTAHTSWLAAPLNVLLYLHLPVDVFIVLSGFCLTLPSVERGSRLPSSSYLAYVLTRAARILPPYYGVLALILVANWFIPVLSWARNADQLTPDLPAGVLWSNLLLVQDLFPSLNRINGPFWSIATEWHLYFAFPLVLLAIRHLKGVATVTLGALAGLGLVVAQQRFGVWSAAFPVTLPSPPHYVFLFVLGVAGAYWSGVDSKRVPGVRRAALAVLCVSGALAGYVLHRYAIRDFESMLVFSAHEPQIDAVVGIFAAAALLTLTLAGPSRVTRLLERRPLVSLGHFSYSLYLLHIPILACAYRAIEHGNLSASGYARFLLLSVLGGGLAIVVARYFGLLFESKLYAALRRSIAMQSRPGPVQPRSPVATLSRPS